MKPLSLYELNTLVRRAVERSLPEDYWLQAELSDVRTHSAGHCYVEFVQKDARGNALLAKARGVIWANVYRLLRPYFERETGQTFAAGIKVLVQVKVEFHELYGHSLTITDIDPTYTVGDMARRRREILLRLEEEGVLTLNKELPMPVLPRRIAVISSPSAAGYGDFCSQLSANPYGFVYETKLFPAVMQGEQVESSVVAALNKINETFDCWDAVVIIRGGGAVSDLAGFDTYWLAYNCAQFPLPIITGIGHERDDTVLDLVAHTRVKTPTAAAEFLINCVHETALRLNELTDSVLDSVRQRLEGEKLRLSQLVLRLPSQFALRKLREENNLQSYWQRLENATLHALTDRRHALQLLQQRVEGCDFEKLMERGFSITLKEGRLVTDADSLKPGDLIQLRFHKGEATAEIK